MNYETAKELEEKGFHIKKRCFCEDKVCVHQNYPTLEELIEACGENFAWLHQSVKSKVWDAQDFIYDEEEGPHGGQGNTPTEAVARLWLSLNPRE